MSAPALPRAEGTSRDGGVNGNQLATVSSPAHSKGQVTVLPARPVPDVESVSHTLHSLRDVMRDLREMRTVHQLFEAAPAAVCRLGFDRAMVSRIEESTWVVGSLHSANDPTWTHTINDLAQNTTHQLSPTLVETDIVRRRIPALVPGAQRSSRVNRMLIDATGSKAYVAAPIMPDGRVMGLLHADRFDQDREVDAVDLDVLSLFADQFAQLLDRALLIERLEGLRNGVFNLTDALINAVRTCGSETLGVATDVANNASAWLGTPLAQPSALLKSSARPGADSVLTSREIEVLDLMAGGDTNARIARRLVISEGTVKSHVKHILRKLNAANRAEAVSCWLRREEPSKYM